MCGIAGWIDFCKSVKYEDKIMASMSEALSPRGPDEHGEFCEDEVYLAHRRLIVVDPEGGKQPMSRSRGGNQYTICYNGELYNTEDIRKELIAQGCSFEGHSDTEVLLNSYMVWGEACVEKLNGIFAFAVWDKNKKELFLARDRMGVKPLFYYAYDGGLIFSSEIRSLLKHPYIKPQLTREGIAQIMLLGPAKAPGGGVFRGINEIAQASCLKFNRDGIFEYEYWHLSAREHTESFEETAEHTRELLYDSIKRQLVSDVPLCTFLSGGLDSSIISAVAAKEYQSRGETLNTYSIDYKFNDINFKSSAFQPDADAPFVRIMADAIGSKHHIVELDTPELTDALADSAYARSLPGMADVDSSLLLFCREIKKDFTVALSGECADEIFGGYPWYHNKKILFCDCFPWSVSTDLRSGLIKKGVLSGIDPFDFVEGYYDETLSETDGLDSDTALERRMREMFMLNIRWFMQTLLDRKDRMSMASGLEVRVPFCDYRLVEYAYNIPWEMKSYKNREKGLLRHAVRDLLPEEIIYRKKSPYPKTHNPDYLYRVKTKVSQIISAPDCRITEFLDRAKLEELIETDAKSFGKPWYGQLMTDAQVFAYLIQLEAWLRHFDVELLI